jgi:pyruvate kinase
MIKRTKIVATVSDMRCDVDFLQGLFDRGVNVMRLNTAHQTPDDTIRVIKNIRSVSDRIAILVDTKGPEVRTGPKQAEKFHVKKGETFYMRYDGPDAETVPGVVQVNYAGFVEDVPVGTSILVDDGYLELTALSKDDNGLKVRVENDGEVSKKKSVNTPGIELRLESVTAKDKAFIEMSIDQGVDYIAHSFVRNKEDVVAVQEILDAKNSDIKIVAKIENREGVENLDEILPVVHGVMVARGDLGIEIPGEEVPLVQKDMIRKCVEASKPVITATQMLESMIKNPRATRAEISDVANAVLDGTDAIMLSGESAYGDYPYESVETMTRIAQHVEEKLSVDLSEIQKPTDDLQFYIAKAAARAATELNLDAIVVPTRTGGTARELSSYRSTVPVYAACYDGQALRTLALSYGIETYRIDVLDRKEVVVKSLEPLLASGQLTKDSLVAIIMSTPGSPEGETNNLEINTVEACLNNYS